MNFQLSYMSEMSRLSLMLDISAIFITAGMIRFTSIYRRRGRFCDRLFYLLEIILLVMAVSDGTMYIVDGSNTPVSWILNHITNHVFFITFVVFGGLLALYLVERGFGGMEGHYGRMLLIMLPALAEVVLILSNIFTGKCFYIDPATNLYTYGPLYPALYLSTLIYSLVSMVAVIKVDSKVGWLVILLLATRMYLGYVHGRISSTAVFFAVGLAFIHIHIMGQSFYEEGEG